MNSNWAVPWGDEMSGTMAGFFVAHFFLFKSLFFGNFKTTLYLGPQSLEILPTKKRTPKLRINPNAKRFQVSIPCPVVAPLHHGFRYYHDWAPSHRIHCKKKDCKKTIHEISRSSSEQASEEADDEGEGSALSQILFPPYYKYCSPKSWENVRSLSFFVIKTFFKKLRVFERFWKLRF